MKYHNKTFNVHFSENSVWRKVIFKWNGDCYEATWIDMRGNRLDNEWSDAGITTRIGLGQFALDETTNVKQILKHYEV